MAIQVTTLMWLRTTMNYQYRYGTTTTQALKTLYSQGGVRRFYRGYAPALFQGPLSRFGDTAANAGTIALLDSFGGTRDLPTVAKSMAASGMAAAFRIMLMPIDACKTILQVEGGQGLRILKQKMKLGGPTVIFHGALATAGATYVGHFPWFFTNNQLNVLIPHPEPSDPKWHTFARNGFIGFAASAVSDTASNSIRVVKTTKQTSITPISYPQALKDIIAKDGVIGLFGRGLKTRLLTNGLQGMLFNVLWRDLSVRFGFTSR